MPGFQNTDARFRRARLAYLREHPLCAKCGRSATVLDHIRPHRGDPELYWNSENWQGLCLRCHGIKTAGETWGRQRPQEKRNFWNG